MKEQTMIRATLRTAVSALLLLGLMQAAFPVRAQQGEPAVMKRAAALRESPGESGRSLAQLPAQEPVTRLGDRQGGWIQVQTRGGSAGWVHMFDVGPTGLGAGAGTRVPSSGGNSLAGGLRGLTNLLAGGGSTPPPRVATATIGIRGLEAEDLDRAQPNLSAVGKMEQLRQGESGARQFAAEAALVAANVSALPAPARGPSPQGGGANQQQP